jgi:predicted DNA-binding helix-hairpin-helix protein
VKHRNNSIQGPLIYKSPDTLTKLQVLSSDARFDLACACGSGAEDRRRKSADQTWIYPVTLANGGKTKFFKILLSNVCKNDCGYCPLRESEDPIRLSLEVEELIQVFMSYYRKNKVFGIFLSSGVVGNPDFTMEKINRVARILRLRENFHGYMHLKVIPGASSAAIEEAVGLADGVSINLESTEDSFGLLSKKKNYREDIIRPLKDIARFREVRNQNLNRYQSGFQSRKVMQTTQFVVGAGDEKDFDLLKYMGGLYNKLGLNRIYFSAYQSGHGRADLPGEKQSKLIEKNESQKYRESLLSREHRLYECDFLIRNYGFKVEEIPLDQNGALLLSVDPKKAWADRNPHFFPLSVYKADQSQLLRVPGLGPAWVNKILFARKNGQKWSCLSQIGKANRRILEAEKYLTF